MGRRDQPPTSDVTTLQGDSGRGGVDEGEIRPDRPSPHEAVGAYVLDALPEAERRAFERHLAGCLDCRAEVAALNPVVALLPRALAGEPSSLPSDGLRRRLLADAVAEPVERGSAASGSSSNMNMVVEGRTPQENPWSGPGDAGEDEDWGADAPRAAPQSVQPATPAQPAQPALPVLPLRAVRPPRPRGRIRPGIPAGPTTLRSRSRPPSVQPVGFGYAWATAAALGLVAGAAIIWALALQGRVQDQKSELAELHRRTGGTGTVWTLAATGDGSPGASGSLLYSPKDGNGALLVRGLAPLPAGRAYQLWYLGGAGEAPVPAGVFTVNDKGEGVLAIKTDLATRQGVAVTAEPATGSAAPTSPQLLNGAIRAVGIVSRDLV